MRPICTASANEVHSSIGSHSFTPKPLVEMQNDGLVAKYTILRLKARGLPIPYRGL
jgi:hypothetical protein